MNSNADIIVNPNVLKWARETIALSKNKASEKAGISIKRLDQLEAGEKRPSLNELRILSKTYKRTIATLLLQSVPKEKPLPIDRRTLDSKEINNFHEKTIMAIRKSRALLQSFIELKEDAGLIINPFSAKATIHESAIDVAKNLRKLIQIDNMRGMKSPNTVLEIFIEKVESLNVAVFQLALTQDDLRGFSIVDERIPIIGIKRSDPISAKIFTLFHELAHIILNEGGICDINFDPKQQQIEKWCNSFAAEILIPKEEFQKIIQSNPYYINKSWTKKELIEIGSHFHVGPLAILRTLLEHNLTTHEFYNEKHIIWNKPSFGRAKKPEGRNIAKEAIKEKGRNYVSLAFRAFDQNRIGLKDLSDFLGVKPSYISKTRNLLNSI